MDKDLSDYLTKFKEENIDLNRDLASKMLTNIAGDIVIFLNATYKQDKKMGDKILALITGAIIIQESENTDDALIRTHNIFKEIRKTIVDLDNEFNKEGLP